LPQALKIIKTKDTKSISLSMYILFVSGVFLWLIYGVLRQDVPVIIANAVTLILASLILYFKIKYP
jgi:MtN3 and saliva related transmembrane protein